MPYMHVYCKYMHVYPAMTPNNTGIAATFPNHSPTIKRAQLRAPHGHGKSVLFVIGNIFADPISGTTPLSTPPGPLLQPPGSSGKPPTP